MNGTHPVRAIVLGLAVLAGCTASSDDALPSGDASDSGGTDDDDGDDGPVTSSADAGDDDGDGDDGPDPATSSGAVEASESEGGDGSTDGSNDDGGVDSSGDGAMDDGGGSVECAALMECCEQLGADIYTGCATVVDLAMPALCDSTLSTYHQEGYCTGETFCADLGAC